MAGTYADVPGHRFMYDQDGTYVTVRNSAAMTWVAQDPVTLNDEDNDGPTISVPAPFNTGFGELSFGFPEPRDITGLFVWRYQSRATKLQVSYSTDSLDGTDGIWTAYADVTGGVASALHPDVRTNIAPLNIVGARGIRLKFLSQDSNNGSVTVYAAHLYGSVAITENTNRLEFWHPTADSKMDKAHLDFGDMPLGSVKTKQFRVKNLSTTHTATGVVVSADNLVGADAMMVDGMTFSADGTTFGPSATIDTLAPSAISSEIHVRRTVLSSEVVATRFARVTAVPSTYVGA